MALGDVLDTFQALPEPDKHEFERWIAKASDDVAYRRRIDILVMAMRSAPRFAAQEPERTSEARSK